MAKSKELNSRRSFSSIKRVIDYPDFLGLQLKSYKDFLQLDTPAEKRQQEGLFKVFSENFPISDSRENYLLEFIDYMVDPPKYSVSECIDRGLTFSVPLKAKLRLSCNDEDNEDFQTIEQEVFLGNIPYMTTKGSFVINGSAIYIEEMFATGHDAANRAAVRQFQPEAMTLAGLALREDRKIVDKIVKGAKLHV